MSGKSAGRCATVSRDIRVLLAGVPTLCIEHGDEATVAPADSPDRPETGSLPRSYQPARCETKRSSDSIRSGGKRIQSPACSRQSVQHRACRNGVKLYSLLKLSEPRADWDRYWQVFDPTEDDEAVFGTLADDIADIYRDLKEGLVLIEAHEVPPEDIIWNWRFSFYSHWGKHAMDALLTVHFRLQNAAS